jgi:hypothetical protein
MARSGGRYVLEKDGKRRLVSRTQEQPRKGAATAGGSAAPKTAPHPLSVSGVSAADREAE